jgi:hypothetical protein
MTPTLVPPKKPVNLITFLEDGTAYVVLLPYAAGLTGPERQRIDAARRVRFFVYGCRDAPVPAGASGIGTLEDYSADSLRWAIDQSTHICAKILHIPQPTGTPQALVRALLKLDARAGNDDHRGVVMFVADRPFAGSHEALYRSFLAPQPSTDEARR